LSAWQAVRRPDPHGADVWRVRLDRPAPVVDDLTRMLFADERERAGRFQRPEHAARFVVGRASLRMILASYLDGLAPSRLAFTYGPRGKPALAEPPEASTLRFNVSHCRDLALIAVTRAGEVGVDVERVDLLHDLEQLAEDHFSAWENAALRGLPAPARPAAFFRCWTRKEAFVKATGEGLARPLDAFSVSLAPGESARLVGLAGDPGALDRWSIFDLAPAPGYAGALVVEGHVEPPRLRDWTVMAT
jgi:4'-phosphopantetheinyl transferase